MTVCCKNAGLKIFDFKGSAENGKKEPFTDN